MRQFAVFALVMGVVISTNVFAENVVVSQATEVGIKKCLPAVNFISDFLIEDGNAGAHSTWHSNTPDKQVFTSVIERNFNDGVLLTSLTVAPVASGECPAVYDQIMYLPKSCFAVSKEVFGNFEYKNTVNKDVVVLESKGVYAYLMPAEGGGCVILKKEVLMNATPPN